MTGNETTCRIGALLRQWRNVRGLTLQATAARAGVAASTLSRWESGKRMPSVPELEAALTVLNVGDSERKAVFRLVDAPRALRHLRGVDSPFAGLPVGGDLLRAMRVRQGMTQTETARAVGATQGQVAKWEKSEAWPDAGRLHAICFALAAQAEEVAALTTGRFRISDEADAPEHDPDAWMARADHALHRAPAPILDLTFLSLESRLWDLRGKEFALPVLAVTYANHARSHLFFRHPERSEMWANRALAIVRGTKQVPEEWGAAVIAVGAAAAAGKRRTDLSRAIQVLEEWLPAISDFRFRAWIMSDLAEYRARMGDDDAAEHISLAAIHEARPDPVEKLYRQRDHARLLLQVGRPAESLEWTETTEETEPEGDDAFVRHCFRKIECLRALGSSTAETLLDQAYKRIQDYSFDHLMPEWERLNGLPSRPG